MQLHTFSSLYFVCSLNHSVHYRALVTRLGNDNVKPIESRLLLLDYIDAVSLILCAARDVIQVRNATFYWMNARSLHTFRITCTPS